MVNLPTRRPDNVNTPAMRALLRTDDGATIYLELNGLAILRKEDTTSLTLRSGEERYAWVNDVLGVVEGVLNTQTDQAVARAYECRNTL